MNLDTSSQLRTITELLMAHVQTISGLGAISGNDNFFRAGLSSIMLTRLKQYVENDFGVDVPMRLFYDRTDSVDKLARYVADNSGEKFSISPSLPILPSGHGGGEQNVPSVPTPHSNTHCRMMPSIVLPPSEMMEIFQQQLNLMRLQLDLLATSSEHTDLPAKAIHQNPPVKEEPLPEITERIFFPLSSAQKRIYFLSRLEEGEAAYHITAAAIIEGRLDVNAFRDAFEKLVGRHESLCTGFEIRNDELVQVRHKNVKFEVAALETEGKDLKPVIRNFVRPFDLSSPPLIRVGIGKLNENTHFLLMDAHHIAIDGFSYNILMPELINRYKGEALPPAPAPYSEYARREQELIHSPAMEKQEAFWLKRFSGDLILLELPLDFPRGRHQRFTGKILRHTMAPDMTKRLKCLAEEQGVSLFMLLLAAYNILLSRLTGEKEIILGTPVDRRAMGDFFNTVGMFSNTLVLRSSVQGNTPFSGFLDQIKKECLNAFDHQDYPFESFVEKLGLERSLSRNPLFDVMFVYEDEDERIIRTDDLIFKPYDIDLWTTNFDFILEVMASDDILNLHLVYSPALFKTATMERWRDYYLSILSNILDTPDILLKDIPVLPDKEKEQLLCDFNATRTETPLDQTIHSLFEQQCRKTPGATAVIFEEKNLSFRELNQHAGQIAAYLHGKFNVGQGDVIGVRLRPSQRLPAALLAAARLGAAFVPIEPDSPEERIRYILEDSGAAVLLTRKDCGVMNDIRIPAINIDDAMVPGSAHRFNGGKPEDVFYIIYTSGTTGLPKGTLVTNRSLVNYLSWFHRNFKITDEDRFLLVSSYAFDMAHTSLWVTLITGAPLHLVSEKNRRDTDLMADYIREKNISCIKITPSYFYTLTHSSNALTPGTLKPLRLVILGGEDIRHDDIQSFLEINPHGVCVNEYGPTEATIACIAHPITRETLFSVKNRQMIGRPIYNTCIYILDPHGNPTPTGVRGEICIGGAGLALGYLNRDELTRAKFKQDPFTPGGRIYLTGDYGRWLPDGTIEFFGRMDQQVKIRGYRVELGEIEQTLLKHPSVMDALVVADTLQSFGRELVAYVVSEAPLTSTLLRAFLDEILPEYMLPAYFVTLPRIPLTPNGKIDRKALPNPLESETLLSPGSPLEVAGTPHERTVTDVWESILGRKDIGIHDNYFSLGGDSIKAVLICARLLNAGLNATVRDIFEAPTIAQLAKRLTNATNFDQRPVTGEAGMLPIQHRFFQLNPHHNAHYTLGMLLTARAPLNAGALQKTCEAIQEHHDALRMGYRFNGPRIIQDIRGITENRETIRSPVFSVMDLRGKPDAEEIRKKHMTELSASINLKTGPLMRTVLYQTDSADRLAVIIHHLVADGVSLRILMEDIEDGYKQALPGKPIRLPGKTDSIAVFAHCLERCGKDKDIMDAFIRRQRHNTSPPATLPFPEINDSGSANTFGNARTMTHPFSQAETMGLIRQSNREISMNIILLTALARAAAKHTGYPSVYIDIEGHGREIPVSDAFRHPGENRYVDVSRTVGWFTTINPIVLKVTETGTLEDDIRSVRETVEKIPGKGLAHGIFQHNPPEPLQTPLTPHHPPEIGFNYLGSFKAPEPDSIFKAVEAPDVPTVDSRLKRWHEVEIEGIIVNDQLVITLSFNSRRFMEKEMNAFLKAWIDEIKLFTTCNAAPCPSHRINGLALPADGGDNMENMVSEAAIQKIAKECHVHPADIKALYPLSPLQEGMLFHAVLEKNDTAFFEQFSFDIHGELNPEAFEKSWNHVMDTFDVFRTAFPRKSTARPLQVVLKKRPIEFKMTDIRVQTETEKNKTVKTFKQNDRQRGFDLSRDVLMRIMVFKSAPAHHHVIWSYHHIVMDGWSCGIMVNTLLRAYTTIRGGMAPLNHGGVPYRNYIEWLSRQDKKRAIEYWKRYLSGYTRPVTLGQKYISEPDELKAHNNGFHLQCIKNIIPEDTVHKLKAMVAQNGVTLNSAMQCAWAILLAHHNGSDDVVFGSVVSGRPAELPGVSEIVGLFLNTVPMRVCLDNDLMLSEMLKKIQLQTLESEPYHYLSLADIQTSTNLGGAVPDNVLIFENYPLSLELLELSKDVDTGFTVDNLEEFEQTNYDLALEVYPDETLTFNLKYNQEKYGTDQINRHGRELTDILQAMADLPDQAVRTVRAVLASGAEKKEQENFLTEIQTIDEEF